MSGFSSRGLRIAIALGDRSATATTRVRGSTRTVVVPVEPERDTVGVHDITAAFGRIASRLAGDLGQDTAGAIVRVALLPPLADARLIRLPPMRRAEAEAVIRRDAARHFTGSAGPRIVSVMTARNGEGEKTGAAFMAAAAGAAVVDAVLAATRATGWRLDTVVPAHGAWLGAAGGSSSVVAVHNDAVHIMRVEGGRCSAVRRAPASLPDEVLESIGEPPGQAVVFADTRSRDAVTATLAAAGWKVDPGRLATAAEAAAANAGRSRLELLPPAIAAERWQRGRRNTLRAAALAILLLASTAVVELWGARRELAAVQAERVAIRDEVEPLLATRDSIDQIAGKAQAIRRLESTAPRWTRALFDLALLLPADAHITSLHTMGDTLVVEATGARAGAALQALRKAGSFGDIRLVGTVERDLEAGTTATERFRFTARLKPPVDHVSHSSKGAVGIGGNEGGRP